jgi:hypothetical protein
MMLKHVERIAPSNRPHVSKHTCNPNTLLRRPIQNQFTRDNLPHPYMDGQTAPFGPQGLVPSSLIRFLGAILRTSTMACDFSADR